MFVLDNYWWPGAIVEPSKWTSFLLSNPIPNLRPSRRLLSHSYTDPEARVPAKRLQ